MHSPSCIVTSNCYCMAIFSSSYFLYFLPMETGHWWKWLLPNPLCLFQILGVSFPSTGNRKRLEYLATQNVRGHNPEVAFYCTFGKWKPLLEQCIMPSLLHGQNGNILPSSLVVCHILCLADEKWEGQCFLLFTGSGAVVGSVLVVKQQIAVLATYSRQYVLIEGLGNWTVLSHQKEKKYVVAVVGISCSFILAHSCSMIFSRHFSKICFPANAYIHLWICFNFRVCFSWNQLHVG